MTQSEYQGLVFPGEFSKNPRLVSFKASFIYHWRQGHHQHFGKDTLFHKPPEAYPLHLRKVHVDIGLYTNAYGESGTQACWNDWSTGRINQRGRSKLTPTSDAYLIYAVTEERHAALLDFWFPPAHKQAESLSSMDVVIQMAEKFYELKSLKPMPRDVNPWDQEFRKKKQA
ncbi:toxin YafO, type II toxin-antitoxin system family protein [Serratia fonticola]|uniref:Toxin YafO, type II toxin-antitoxin system family protein n=1 Tax=Serratia fonticola TaxID=47917 RepID=A0ABY9PSQ7_SERFO|nr:toxin YafO, type II toxin-antitoxin system family protein [Serratia fonticola]WMT16037.1 toxin YafO, type II toxin-antitoxin system family protein [Serratia fonticola]